MAIDFEYDSGLELRLKEDLLTLEYGPDIFGPCPEMRVLDQIRPSLRDANCSGPDPVYGIAMDIGRNEDRQELESRMLLFAAVAFSSGKLGREPVRSQGHVHAPSASCGWSAPEIFEIWMGKAIIYGQERTTDDPGRCIAVLAHPGEKVVMPPGWAHCVINANPETPMVFGALCNREFGFDYTGVRAHGGLAWFPVVSESGTIRWEANSNYSSSFVEARRPRRYVELALESEDSLYRQLVRNPDKFMYVANPETIADQWRSFVP